MRSEDPADGTVYRPYYWPVAANYVIKDGTIQPDGPNRHQYDPIQRPELARELAKLHGRGDAELLGFAETYGIPSADSPFVEDVDRIKGHAAQASLVLELHKAGLNGQLDAHISRDIIDRHGFEFVQDVIDGRDRYRALPQGVMTRVSAEMWFQSDLPKAVPDLISRIVNSHLLDVSEQLDPRSMKLRPKVYSLIPAIFWHVVAILQGGVRLARCEYPRCRSLFVQTDGRQKYCPVPDWHGGTVSSLCGERHRKEKQRHKKEDRSNGQAREWRGDHISA